MNKEEKILMIKLLLEDIRGNWSWENGNRDEKAYELSMQLYKKTKDENWLEMSETIASYDNGDDGRYFRDDFPCGYLGMEKLYSITETYADKSDEFKNIVENYITFPEYAFKDWNEREE